LFQHEVNPAGYISTWDIRSKSNISFLIQDSNYERLLKEKLIDNVITLNSKKFEAYVEAPRNYSIVVVLTAMSPDFGCNICIGFDPEFRLVNKYHIAHSGCEIVPTIRQK
jgi:hypothetical protein